MAQQPIATETQNTKKNRRNNQMNIINKSFEMNGHLNFSKLIWKSG